MLNGSSTRSSLRLLLDTPHRRGYFPTYEAFRHGVAGAQRRFGRHGKSGGLTASNRPR